MANLKSLFKFFVPVSALLLVTSVSTAIEEDLVQQEFLRLQSDPDHSLSFEINAPIEFVFEFLSQRVQDYTDDATAVSFVHDNFSSENSPGVGSLRITTMENGEQLVQRFLRYDPPTAYAYITDMEASTIDVPLSYSLASYELADINNEGTLLQVSVVYRASSRLLSFFVSRAFNSALENDFETAVELIEAEYSQSD